MRRVWPICTWHKATVCYYIRHRMGVSSTGEIFSDCFAAKSTGSLPKIPEWAGIQAMVTSMSHWRDKISEAIGCCLDLDLSCEMEFSESVKITTLLSLLSIAMFKDVRTAYSSHERILNKQGSGNRETSQSRMTKQPQ